MLNDEIKGNNTMRKSDNYILSEELYKNLDAEQKKRISFDLFYNAICCFHDIPCKKIADMLMELKDEEFKNLENALAETRAAVREMHTAVCGTGKFNSAFASSNIEDILFYRISNDLPMA